MGTTLTALTSEDSIQLCYVLCIEGYANLLSTWNDTDAVVTAWAGTSWSAALPGLNVNGTFSQRWDPFGNDLQVHAITCLVHRDHADQFGIDVFKKKPTFSASLRDDFDPTDTVITLSNTTGLPTEGTVNIGVKAYSYTAKTATTLTGVASASAAISADGLTDQAPWKHSASVGNTVQSPVSAKKPKVTSEPTLWVGRTVALYLHRVVDGVLDVKSEAHLKFAGKISSINESSNGEVVLQMDDFRRQIADTIIMQDQWQASVANGYSVVEGTLFTMVYVLAGSTTVVAQSTPLTAVTGASGTDQIEPGTYSIEEFVEILELWLNSDANIGSTVQWDVGIQSFDAGHRFFIEAVHGSQSFNLVSFGCNSEALFTSFLGLMVTSRNEKSGRVAAGSYTTTTQFQATIVGTQSPRRSGSPIPSGIFSIKHSWDLGRGRMDVASPSGIFADLTSDLPGEIGHGISAGEQWSLFSLNDQIVFLGRYNTTYIDHIRFVPMFPVSHDVRTKNQEESTIDDPDVVKQICVITGTFTDVVTSLLASVDGSGSNHSTYDRFPFGAKLPWGVLGNAWLASCSDVEQSNATDSLLVVIEKPTSLWDLIKSDLILRNAFFVWKNGGLVLSSFQSPNASAADYTIDETTKGQPVGSAGSSFTETQYTQEWMTNNVKLQYNRDASDWNKYTREVLIRDTESIETFGLGKPVTIKARNSYRASAQTGESVEILAEMIVSRIVPVFGRTVRIWRTTGNHKLSEMAPGDTVNFNDNFARNPTTGIAEVFTRGAVCLSNSHSLGIGSGPGAYQVSLELLFSAEDRNFPMAPCALSDNTFSGSGYTSGWDSVNRRIATLQNEYSVSGQAADSTNFENNDAVRVISIDPAQPNLSDTFLDSVTGVSSTSPFYVGLTFGFGVGGRPAYDANKSYRIISDAYSSAQNSQRLHAYQAADDDELIENLIEPNLWGHDNKPSIYAPDITLGPPRHSIQSYAEGTPLHAGIVYDLITMANAITNYRCAPAQPVTSVDTATTDGLYGSSASSVRYSYPVYIGGLHPSGVGKLVLSVSALMERIVGAAANTSIEVISSSEPGSLADVDLNDPTWRSRASFGRQSSVILSITSTTRYTQSNVETLPIIPSTLHPAITFITICHVAGTDDGYFGGLNRCYLELV